MKWPLRTSEFSMFSKTIKRVADLQMPITRKRHDKTVQLFSCSTFFNDVNYINFYHRTNIYKYLNFISSTMWWRAVKRLFSSSTFTTTRRINDFFSLISINWRLCLSHENFFNSKWHRKSFLTIFFGTQKNKTLDVATRNDFVFIKSSNIYHARSSFIRFYLFFCFFSLIC